MKKVKALQELKKLKSRVESLKMALQGNQSNCACNRFSGNKNEFDLYIDSWISGSISEIEEMILKA